MKTTININKESNNLKLIKIDKNYIVIDLIAEINREIDKFLKKLKKS